MSRNVAIIDSTGTDVVAQAFADAAAGLAAHVLVLWVPGDEDDERRGSPPFGSFDDARWAEGIAFGTPIGDGRPAGALMRFIEGMEPLWTSRWLSDKVVTVFADQPERIAPDSSWTPIYDVLYRSGAVIVGARAIELALDARAGLASARSAACRLPAARLKTAQYRAARAASLAGVLADERHRQERFAL